MDDPSLRERVRQWWDDPDEGGEAGWKGWWCIDFSVSVWPAGLSFVSLSPVCPPPLTSLGDSQLSLAFQPPVANYTFILSSSIIWELLVYWSLFVGRILTAVPLSSISVNQFCMLPLSPGTSQRGLGPPTHCFPGLSSPSSHWPFAVFGHSAVTTASAAITGSIIDHQPLSSFCSFLPTTTEWLNRDFTEGEKSCLSFCPTHSKLRPSETAWLTCTMFCCEMYLNNSVLLCSLPSVYTHQSTAVTEKYYFSILLFKICLCVCVSVQVVHQTRLVEEAAHVLSSLDLRLDEGSCLSDDTVHLKIKGLQNTITHMLPACWKSSTHTPSLLNKWQCIPTHTVKHKTMTSLLSLGFFHRPFAEWQIAMLLCRHAAVQWQECVKNNTARTDYMGRLQLYVHT